ncbi:helix-turn-helix domain-containing protein [Nocardia sp. NPDC088792]|uniref:helix-turn-helix domain-containing protein n=1 Tax=Nocardia sp. NPDC088792 TaxID=3364332 RepID=UPI0037FB0ECF
MADNYFGEYIRQRRQDALLTRTELAHLANISVSLLEKIELGTRPTTLPTLQALLDQLGVPSMQRKYILDSSLAGVYGTSPNTSANPTAIDLADLESLPHPAGFYLLPTFTIAAANTAHRTTFPGLDSGTNLVEWMLLNPVARKILPEWDKEIHRLVHSIRMLTPHIDSDEQVAKALQPCRQAPEWDDLWHNTPPTRSADGTRILVRDIVAQQTRPMDVRIYSPEIPNRRWWLCRLIQRNY